MPTGTRCGRAAGVCESLNGANSRASRSNWRANSGSRVARRAKARLDGRLLRRLDPVRGQVALIECVRDFILVPRRPVLEPQLGNRDDGLMRPEGISWRFVRGRTGPEIT